MKTLFRVFLSDTVHTFPTWDEARHFLLQENEDQCTIYPILHYFDAAGHPHADRRHVTRRDGSRFGRRRCNCPTCGGSLPEED